MAELRFEPAAHAALVALLANPKLQILADHVEEKLDALEANPNQPELTRSEFMTEFGLMYALRVSGNGEDWMLAWQKASEGTVVVYYLGPFSLF